MDNVASKSLRVARILEVRLMSNEVLFFAKATAGVIGLTITVPPKSFMEKPLVWANSRVAETTASDSDGSLKGATTPILISVGALS